MFRLFFRESPYFSFLAIILAVVSLVSLSMSFAWADTDSPDRELAITLYPDEHRLSGRDDMTVTIDDQRPILTTLAPTARIRGVTSDSRPLRYDFDNGRLKVYPPEGARERLNLGVEYDVRFDDKVPERTYAGDNPGYGVTGIIGPEGVFLLAGAGWYPLIDTLNERVRLTVTAPEGWEAVTAGKRLAGSRKGGATESVWLIGKRQGDLALSAGNYVIGEKMSGGVPVYTYFYPESAGLSQSYLDAADRYLTLYSKQFGPYPFEKFAIVENFFPTGYGFPSYTLLGRTVLHLPFIIHTSLGHEIAHCWWGNGVLVDYRSGNWSEALATYVADYRYREMESPEAAEQYRMKILRDYAVLVTPENDFPLRDFRGRVSPVTKVIGYGKGAMVFHMARKLVGEEAFWGGLRDVFRDGLFREASWSDFAAAFGKRAGMDLTPFIDQWVNRAGAPFLGLEKVEAGKKDRDWAVSGVITQTEPVYRLRIPVRVSAEKNAVDVAWESRSTKVSFSIPSENAPLEVAVDPDADLFRRLYPAEIAPIVNSLRDADEMAVIVSKNAGEGTVAAARIIMESLGKASSPVLPESQATKETFKNKNILLVGPSLKPDLLPAGDRAMNIGPASFSFMGRVYEAPGDCLFAVFQNPYSPGKAVAVLYPLSDDAARAVATKIRHYGTYSYLIFQNGRNVEKGLWRVQSSPLTRRFARGKSQTSGGGE